MEEEKKYIYTKTFNSLKKHAELIEETKELVKVCGIYYLLIIQVVSFSLLLGLGS